MSSFTDLENTWQQQPGSGADRPQPESLIKLAEQKANRYEQNTCLQSAFCQLQYW